MSKVLFSELGLVRICPLSVDTPSELSQSSQQLKYVKKLLKEHKASFDFVAPDLSSRIRDLEVWNPRYKIPLEKLLARLTFRSTPVGGSHPLALIQLGSSLQNWQIESHDFESKPYLTSKNEFGFKISISAKCRVQMNPTVQITDRLIHYWAHSDKERGELTCEKYFKPSPLILRILKLSSRPLSTLLLARKLKIKSDERAAFAQLLQSLHDSSILLSDGDPGPYGQTPSALRIQVLRQDIDAHDSLAVDQPTLDALGQVLTASGKAESVLAKSSALYQFMDSCARSWDLQYQDSEIALLEVFSDEFKSRMTCSETLRDLPMQRKEMSKRLLQIKGKEILKGPSTLEFTRAELDQWVGQTQEPPFPNFQGTALLSPLIAQDQEKILLLNGWVSGDPLRLVGHGSSYFPRLATAARRIRTSVNSNEVLAQIGYSHSDESSFSWSQPPSCDYVVPLNHLSSTSQRTLPLEDLVVRRRRGEWQLFSRSLGKRIRLINTLIFNPSSAQSFLARFLFGLAALETGFSFSRWSTSLDEGSLFSPRWKFGCLILKRASWLVDKNDILSGKASLPKHISFETDSGFLEFELGSCLLKDYLSKTPDEVLRVHEGLRNLGEPRLRISGRSHHCDVAVPFRTHSPTKPVPIERAPRRRARIFETVLAIELHFQQSAHVHLALDKLAQARQTLTAKSRSKWYYLVFANPSAHIRLRFPLNGTKPHLESRLLPILKDAFSSIPGIEIRFRGFEIEDDHYPGEDLEKYFELSHLDSVQTLSLLARSHSEPVPVFEDLRLLKSRLRSIDRILELRGCKTDEERVLWLQNHRYLREGSGFKLTRNEAATVRDLAQVLVKHRAQEQISKSMHLRIKTDHMTARLLHLNSRRHLTSRPEVFERLTLDLSRRIYELRLHLRDGRADSNT